MILLIDDFRGTPLALVERAIRARTAELRDARKEGGRASDEIWCVFDFDVHPHVQEAIELAGRHEINVAASNPCIELWFILHHEEHTAHIERDIAQRRSAELLGCGKHLTNVALAALDPLCADAVRRAKQLDRKHAGDGSLPRSNPSTDMGRLADRIRSSNRR